MASGAPAPIAGSPESEREARRLNRSVREQLERAPGGRGAIYGRDENAAGTPYDDQST